MKKISRSIIGFLLMFSCVVSFFSVNTYASELKSKCTVKFMVIDSSGSYDGTSFTVKMDDIMGEASEEFVVEKAASWGSTTGNVPAVSVPAPTTYNITISGLKEGYKLHDYMAGSDIDTSFAATSKGEVTFYWEIIPDDGTTATQEVETTKANATANIVADNADAEGVYKEFLDNVSFIKDDPTWESFLHKYGVPGTVNVFARLYSTYVDNGDKSKEEMIAEFEAMSNYDRFLWITTYLFMADKIYNGLPDELSYEDMVANTACPMGTFERRKDIDQWNNADTVIAAYDKLLHWQADYIAANGSPYNFINNRSYIEEVGGTVDKPKTDENIEEQKKKDQEDIAKIQKEMEKEVNKEEDKGIWSDTLDILSSNLITILILFILLGGLGYVIYLKKKNNYTDDIHEKK